LQYNGKVVDHLGLVAGMIDELGIVESIDQVIQQDLEKRHLSIGECVKAMILNGLGFTGKPLYLTPEFFKTAPLELLLREGIEPEHLNDNTLGRALDSLYRADVSSLFALISTQAFHALDLTPEYAHLDSTSFKVYGKEYAAKPKEEYAPETIEVTYGFSKDHRPDLLQFMLNLIVDNRAGIPMAMEPLSGNSSDKVSFVQTIESHIGNLTHTSQNKVVVDSALYSAENLQTEVFKSLHWVTRVPETLSSAKEQIALSSPECMRVMDLKKDEHRESAPFLGDNTKEPYAYRAHISYYADIEQQWIVVYSKQARDRSYQTLVRQFTRQTDKEMQLLERFEKETFECKSDMQKALDKLSKKLKVVEIVDTAVVKSGRYDKAGRPSKQKKKQYDHYVYNAAFTLSSSLQTFKKKLHQKSCFILAANDMSLSPEEIFDNYKNQHTVERGFRFLKGKEFLSDAIFLKSPERIEALLFIMTLSLMVYAALEYRIRTELSSHDETVDDQKGKPTSTPTARWIFHCFIGIQLLIIDDKEHIMMNVNNMHRLVLALLGKRYLDIYLI
jgi:transposase